MSERTYEDGYQQALADAAMVLRVQGDHKLTPQARDGYYSAANSVIDLHSEPGPDRDAHIADMRERSGYAGAPRRQTLHGDHWTEDGETP